MHYYQFNIADYRKDTGHLTPTEHYIYRFLIDWYYLDEQPIPRKTQLVMRRLRLVSENNKDLENILDEFFVETENGWIHKRIDDEISKYKLKADTARVNGSKGGRPKKENKKPKKTQPVNYRNPEKTGLKANHKPITINQYIKEKYKKENFNSSEIKLFDEYLEIRKKKKYTLSKTVTDRLVKKYIQFGRSTEIIEKAIMGSWKDFYETKENNYAAHQRNIKTPQQQLDDSLTESEKYLRQLTQH